MQIPQFWTKADARVQRGRHSGFPVTAWGWSETGEAEARRMAEQRAQALVQRIEQDDELPRESGRRYGYPDRPLREQVLGVVRSGHRVEPFSAGDDPSGAIALITRNGYGAEVLNTERLLMLDADRGPQQPQPGFLARLFGAKPKPEDDLLERVRGELERAGGSWRIYRTAAGFRLIRVDRPLSPGDPESQRLLSLPFVDDAYRNLCRVQESYRARLTPKPYRCGLRPPAARFPYLAPAEADEIDRWVARYEQVIPGYATCHFVEAVGGHSIDRQLAGLVQLHDERTAATSEKPLA